MTARKPANRNFSDWIEDQIREAEERGEFDNLPGKGKPLKEHLTEVIAERRHHPQKDAIKTLCILSLFFGGMLWPLAWLWAYTRPTLHRAVYGTDRHDDYYVEMGDKARAGTLTDDELDQLRVELDSMAAKGHLPPQLKGIRQHLDERDSGARPPIKSVKVAEET